MSIDAVTSAHDAVAGALRQLEAAWRIRQENPDLLRPALDSFQQASAALARAIEQQEANSAQ